MPSDVRKDLPYRRAPLQVRGCAIPFVKENESVERTAEISGARFTGSLNLVA